MRRIKMAKEMVFWFWADRTRPDLKAKDVLLP
jgi:hypothetical protein